MSLRECCKCGPLLEMLATSMLVALISLPAWSQAPPPPPTPDGAESNVPEPDPVDDEASEPSSQSDDESTPPEPQDSLESSTNGAPPPPPPPDDIDLEGDGADDASRPDASASASVKTETKEGRATPVQRMALESLGGLGGMIGGYMGGAITGAIVGGVLSQDSLGILFGAVIGGGLGSTVGMPLGIWAVGNSVGGNGNFWATFGGSMLGLLAVGAIAGAASNGDPAVYEAVVPAATLTLPIAGGITGYELTDSARDSRRSSSTAPRPGLRWSASAGPARDGEGGMLIFKASW